MTLTYNCGGSKPSKENIGCLKDLLLGRKRTSSDSSPEYQINSADDLPEIYAIGI